MRQSPLEKRLTDMFAPVIEDNGLSLVAVKVVGEEHNRIVQVLAEDPQTHNLGLDQCAAVSRELSALMDVEDPIKKQYRLEVSSPGIDRPLTREQDYETYKGLDAKIEIDPPLEGQKRFRGKIARTGNNMIKIETDEGVFEFPFTSIVKSKLVMNDELIKATRPNQDVSQASE